MKQTIRLTESELRDMIEMSINEAMQDEELMDEFNLRSAIRGGVNAVKNAFGGDAERIGQGAQRAVQSVGRGAQRVGQAVQQGAENVKQGAENVKQGAQNRLKAAKAGYQATQNNDKIDRIINDLTDLQTSGVLHGRAMTNAINVLMTNLKQAKGRNNSTASAYRNAI